MLLLLLLYTYTDLWTGKIFRFPPEELECCWNELSGFPSQSVASASQSWIKRADFYRFCFRYKLCLVWNNNFILAVIFTLFFTDRWWVASWTLTTWQVFSTCCWWRWASVSWFLPGSTWCTGNWDTVCRGLVGWTSSWLSAG